MKIDKDFAVKVEGRVFTADEISSVSFDVGWFTMNCISKDGTKFTVEASLKDVEFLSNAPVHGLQVEEEFRCNVFGDKARRWVVYESDKNNAEPEITVEGVKQAVREYMVQMSDAPKIDVQFTSPYCKVGDEPKSDVEVVYPFRRTMEKTAGEAMKEMYASMKSAGESINECLKAMEKSNESIKANLLIDCEQFAKLIKKYNQDITRSGG